ncbi:MAG: hypothetical protein K2W82_17730 [Candidatus Obscuribacterales bacterium]|nr:hypothetical protein [Candidatus Obscuribacterales bacterium]
MSTSAPAAPVAPVVSLYGRGIPAAPADVSRLLTEAHIIIWQDDQPRFKRAVYVLREAVRLIIAAPHTPQVLLLVCYKKLAKIARIEGNYSLANQRLDEALKVAVMYCGQGHVQTLRLLEKKAQVCDTAHAWRPAPDRSLIPANERKHDELVEAVKAVYAQPLHDADLPAHPGTVTLMRADMSFALERYEEALELYNQAGRELRADDSNRERLKERRQKCVYECS